MQKAINLVFPNQLFVEGELLENGAEFYLIEENLFFTEFLFHKQKIAFHRSSMKSYQQFLEDRNKKVTYIDYNSRLSDIRLFSEEIAKRNITEINVFDPVDNWLEKRLHFAAKKCKLNISPSPLFINSEEDLRSFFNFDKKNFLQASFYKDQRLKYHILLDNDKDPVGGKWSLDAENRKKYPKGKTPAPVHFPEENPFWNEALIYTEKHFKNNPGKISKERIYPIDHKEANDWFSQFLEYRFFDFGPYEDAIVSGETFLNHSGLSPLINVGLISPSSILTETLNFANKERIPLNSTEGFIRQIVGWREFIRGIYKAKGSYSRTKNFWNFNRKIPRSFYDGSTGIPPIDETIKKVLNTGYCHHIERLMILSNFMLLCEFDPNEVYKWFMELFIDAYDWVMVPNIYGMGQFADGGVFATKPYISGSNYINKMSDYPHGDWEQIWDGLFWRFVHKNQDFFKSNQRISMLYYAYSRLPESKKIQHLDTANKFLDTIN
ncbi:deoxyribodipyrimidine photolyase-related protein [Pedobacter sp. UYEF25]